MAWPLSVLTVYVGGSTPPIYAEDLNDIQEAIVAVHLGTNSLKAVTVDGTGGAVVAPTAGRITASENVVATGDVSCRHLISTGANPTIAAHASTDVGDGATFAIQGEDSVHLITITPGGSGINTEGDICTVTFGTAYTGLTAARVVLMPANAKTADMNVYVSATSTTAYSITSTAAGADIVTGETMIWNVHILAH